jgi:cytochrome c biogenesis protein CcmG/thiol:disulfide interchange protein DsbE
MAWLRNRHRKLPARSTNHFQILIKRVLAASCLGLAGIASISGGLPISAAHAAVPAAPFDLSAYKGKVVYLDFWASWCAPCRLSFPFMRSMNATYGSRNFVVVAVNLDRDHGAAQAFLQRYGGGVPVLYDPTGKIASEYKVGTMPTSVLIGRDGKVRYVHRGYFANKTAEYQQHIAALVAEHP